MPKWLKHWVAKQCDATSGEGFWRRLVASLLIFPEPGTEVKKLLRTVRPGLFRTLFFCDSILENTMNNGFV